MRVSKEDAVILAAFLPEHDTMGFTPTQMATASLFSQIGGAASGAIGGYYSAATQKTMFESQADLAKINARISELGAQSALRQGQQQVGAMTLKAGQLKGSQRAAMAANGIDIGTGSAAEIQASTDIIKEIDANTIMSNAVRSAWGYRTQSMNMQNEAMMAKASAGGISPFGSMASSLLGSAGSVASSWYALNKAGAFDAANATMAANDFVNGWTPANYG